MIALENTSSSDCGFVTVTKIAFASESPERPGGSKDCFGQLCVWLRVLDMFRLPACDLCHSWRSAIGDDESASWDRFQS